MGTSRWPTRFVRLSPVEVLEQVRGSGRGESTSDPPGHTLFSQPGTAKPGHNSGRPGSSRWCRLPDCDTCRRRIIRGQKHLRLGHWLNPGHVERGVSTVIDAGSRRCTISKGPTNRGASVLEATWRARSASQNLCPGAWGPRTCGGSPNAATAERSG